MIGNVLRSRYQILRDLGKGGFGKTYLAKDLDMPGQNTCVVKQLIQHANPQTQYIARRLFQTEAETLHRLGKHDQIPSLFAYFEENGNFYLVQEFVDGHDLDAELPPGNRLSSGQTRRLLQEILEVLVFVHRQNVIHRDIKPSNLMRRNSDGKLVLIDFGSVKQIRAQSIQTQNKTQLTVGIYTEGYAPDEQILGKPKLASDIYAVGMLGIQALTGIQPSELTKDPNTEEVLWRHQATGVNPRLADVLSKMVRCHFRERYQNASEALQALGYRYSPPPLTSAPPPSPAPSPSPSKTIPVPQTSPRPPVRFPWQSIVGATAVVFLGTWLWNGVSPGDSPVADTGDRETTEAIQMESQPEVPEMYAQLNRYLKNREWRAADEVTTDLLLRLGDKDNSDWLDTEEIEGLSCNALKSIDQLWVQYSEGRFGFSVQKDIYLELGGTKDLDLEVWEQFGDRVGWRRSGSWLYYNNLPFTLEGETPRGQLPLKTPCLWVVCDRVVIKGDGSSSLMWRLVNCSI